MANKNLNKTILLTGAGGFIGSHILNNLITNNFTVIAITRSTDSIPDHRNLAIIKGLFYDPALLDTIDSPIDAIVHCAAIRGESNLPESEYHKVNIAGTEALLQFTQKRKIPRFVYLSSVGILGTIPKDQPASHLTLPNPDGKYHQSKWQAEELVRQYHSDHLKTLILRPTITYGTGDNGFIPKLIQLVRSRHFVYPAKQLNLHLLSVTALADLIVTIFDSDRFQGQTYIVADKTPVLLKSLIDMLSRETNGKDYPARYRLPAFVFNLVKWIMRKLNYQQMFTSLQLISENWTYDISETISQLGYKPAETIDSLSKYMEAAPHNTGSSSRVFS